MRSVVPKVREHQMIESHMDGSERADANIGQQEKVLKSIEGKR